MNENKPTCRLVPEWIYQITIAVLFVIILMLSADLITSRNNEREMSRKLYQSIRQGYSQPATTNGANP